MLKIICYDKEGEEFPFQDIANAVYKRLNQTARECIEISFSDEEEIRELNRTYRHVDKITDVLSFPFLDGIKGKVLDEKDYSDEIEEDGIFLGSITICLKRAKEQAEEYGHSFKREVSYLALHGILHLFGYDHIEKADEEEMTLTADEIMKGLNILR